MAVKTYSESELKAFVKSIFDRIPNIPPEAQITDPDVTTAYEWATAQLGYEIPGGSDSDRSDKYTWLVNRMKSHLYDLLVESYASIADIGNQKVRQIWNGFKKRKEELDKVFAETYIDIGATPIVRGSGTVINNYGEDKSYEQLGEIDREDGTIDGIDN